ncbi:MAG: hypothetical protein RJB66_985 [Pseudomonadota bacterium]|jgi:hypothetical protein
MNLIITTVLLITSSVATAKAPPHLDIEMSGYEYEKLIAWDQLELENQGRKHAFDDIFVTGKRNLDWIRLLNQNRIDKISLSTPESQQGFPINNPRVYNPEIIRASYNDLKEKMPESLRTIIFSSTPLPPQLPSSLEEYITWGLEVDRVYQIAARWRTLEPYREHLLMNGVKDIRGYHFITSNTDLMSRLKNWNSLATEEKPLVTQWLNQVCSNHLRDTNQCSTLTQRAIQKNQALSFFESHRAGSEEIISEMMHIPDDGKFGSVKWETQNEVKVPFKDPIDLNMRSYLLNNIEQEWNYSPFSLKINWVPQNAYGVEVIWSPGVTPHVPGLGSHQIYMDANAPISEYDVQWTIRHEFGHVLGFPDCYLEFYDPSLSAIVAYQLDTSDLMCSRRGHLKERHVEEIRKTY